MINNIKVGTKLIVSFLAVVVILAIVATIGYFNIKSIAGRGNVMYKQNTAAIEDMGAINANLEKMRGDIYRYLSVPAERNKMSQSINEIMNSVTDTMKNYKARDIGSDEKKIIADFDAAWPEMQRGYKELLKMGSEDNNVEVDRLLADGSYVIEARKHTFAAVKGLNEFNRKSAEAANQANGDAASKASAVVLIASILAVAVALTLGLVLTMSITSPLKKALVMIQELGKGHLSDRLNINRKDEIGALAKAMDQFADDLKRYVVAGMQKIAQGDINIETPMMDERDEIGPALKMMVVNIGNLVKEMNMLTRSAMEGKLDIRGNEMDFPGSYREIVAGVNRTLDAVMGPINEASDVLSRVANQDMTARVKGEYKGDHAKIKESLNMAVANLDKALQQVAVGAEQVASASVQVSTGGQSLSQGASEQASSLEEISSNLQEMSSMTKQNAMNAKEAKGVAEQARESADKGVESMNRMSSAINKIKTSSDATAKIVKTIDEIAFQTNLLALNAAVEAARAGDAGKGFAVVAEEVRNLAMRSAEAAKNTANLIEEAVKNSENGVSINVEVLMNFKDITDRINKVSHVVAEIAAASDQQDVGIGQVNKAIEQLNQVTQQNAANAEESASAAEEMSSQSEEMRSMIAGFKLNGSGKSDYVLLTDNQQKSMSRNLPTGKKGSKAMSGLQPDPRNLIPLDDSDHRVLEAF
ncbi:MAG: methyl-accepting chemotaxis protein [Syntrophaceae bacterium]|nr:methyl-accepting chemotaxis protein [Syntrophaceae bacterium]